MRWLVSDSPVAYEEALSFMERHVAGMRSGDEDELVWLLEHPSLYTGGLSARSEDLLVRDLPVYSVRRGGQYTYHGPGQRVIYGMLDLRERGRDVRLYVRRLERWLILSLSRVGVRAFCRSGRVGLWVYRDNVENSEGYEDKIASIGVRVQRWITSHGVSVNVCPDLGYFGGIVPCGIRDARLGVTSLAALGIDIGLSDFDIVLRRSFTDIFG